MLHRRHLLTIAATAAFFPVAAVAGTKAPTFSDTLTELGPEGTALALRAGVWDVTETAWDTPKSGPVTTTNLIAERRMIGSMMQEYLRDPADTSGASIKRIDYLTFNRVEGRWDYVSMDMRDPFGIMSAWSLDRDPGDRIVVEFQPFAITGDGLGDTGKMLRMQQITTRNGPNHDAKDQYFISPDGSGTKWLGHRYAYTRR
ncbi:hypothetical protein [Acidisoma cladoniae]|jgi:hypothetical protein|uniref:hypothetical protein n=1 Tax=Acidisoma cladoniae TaxID=3040935 RepID=UPI00254CB8FE|nr:hypothetical protein [Acidisoma sp. PAMC 29798]